ncbi:MAG TPA: class II aldolase/adducin family protein [Gemmatimonadaceae bacterium]|nr:class II aldolase/adducin family protein [Gemmatimonadaceae bacterium]
MSEAGGVRSGRTPLRAFPSPAEAAAEIVRVCRRLDARGLVAGPDGNVSVRLAMTRLLVTPSGMTKGLVTAEDLVEVDLAGAVLRGARRPSSELRMHLRIYAGRDDVGAVVHAHPPTATGFAVAGEDFLTPVLPEIILQLGGVPLLPFAVPGGDALAATFDAHLAAHDAFLLANHGATTLGPTLELALQRMESLEHAARILLAARQLGRVNALTDDQLRALTRGGDAGAPAAAAPAPRTYE